MKCPFCGNVDSRVADSRAMEESTVIKRRRICEACGEKFTTYERLDTIPLTVIKRNGTREAFDRNKLLNGIMRSCNKRTVSVEQMEKVVSEIESVCQNSMKQEIETKEIGEFVMHKLKNLDEVAYVRFASVYRQFKDIDTFMEELGKMLKEKQE
ncbi:MAG: transcriptional regulator NrdR [Clostridiales bacterium]|jgi:transcriptional repressor NrdR|nr:transcriptional regulator NrdR [Clostridiales bacterium]